MSAETACALFGKALKAANAGAGSIVQHDNDPSFRAAAFRTFLLSKGKAGRMACVDFVILYAPPALFGSITHATHPHPTDQSQKKRYCSLG
jgi:hypothetical protein